MERENNKHERKRAEKRVRNIIDRIRKKFTAETSHSPQ